MGDRFTSTFGLVAGLALAALAAAGIAEDAPKKFDLGTKNRWEKDEVVTVTHVQRMEMTMNAIRPDGKAAEQTREKREESVVVWRCLEATEKGSRLRAHAYVRSWSVKDEKSDDTSVTGAFVEVTPEKWTMLSPGIKPSPAARKWLDTTFGPKAKDEKAGFDSLGAPPSLAVGESWRMPPEAMQAFMSARGGNTAGLDTSKVECTVTLVAAEETPKGPRLRATIQLSGPLGGAVGGAKGATVSVAEGSRVSFDGEIVSVLGGSHRDERLSGPMEMKLNVAKDGNVVTSTATAHLEKTRVPGGEMPDPPKTESPAPPTVPPAVPTEPAPK